MINVTSRRDRAFQENDRPMDGTAKSGNRQVGTPGVR